MINDVGFLVFHGLVEHGEDTFDLLDESLFCMVINNIVINAIHYTPEGGDITVECRSVNRGQTLEGKLFGNF